MNTSTIFNQLPVDLKNVVADFVTAQPASHHKALMDELLKTRKETLLTLFAEDIYTRDWNEKDGFDFDNIDHLELINEWYVKNFGWDFNIMPSVILEIKRDGFEMPENAPGSDGEYSSDDGYWTLESDDDDY
tara:strand:- start:326 stop:721 length:396 start_codon:yes stop_codon:yes gene_type:complete